MNNIMSLVKRLPLIIGLFFVLSCSNDNAEQEDLNKLLDVNTDGIRLNDIKGYWSSTDTDESSFYCFSYAGDKQIIDFLGEDYKLVAINDLFRCKIWTEFETTHSLVRQKKWWKPDATQITWTKFTRKDDFYNFIIINRVGNKYFVLKTVSPFLPNMCFERECNYCPQEFYKPPPPPPKPN